MISRTEPAPAEGRFVEGTRLCSRYVLQRIIGSGGMATVWLARDETLNRQLALKVISDALAADPAYVARFEREARTAASVSHRNLVQIYDYSSFGGRPFLVMEYLPGGSLRERLKGGDRLTAGELRELARDLLSALGCIHRRGILHRDVKPGNVLLDASGRARLTDFGIARAATDSTLTLPGQLLGTARYLAPEVLGDGEPTVRADLYALGALLGDAPVGGELEADLRNLIAELTDPQPSRRPVSAAEALGRLRAADDAGQATQEFDVVAANRADPEASTRMMPARPAPEEPVTEMQAATAREAWRPGRVLAIAGALLIFGLVALIAGSGGSTTPDRTATHSRVAASRTTQTNNATRRAPRPATQPTTTAAPAAGAVSAPPGQIKKAGPGAGPGASPGPGRGHGHGRGHGPGH